MVMQKRIYFVRTG